MDALVKPISPEQWATFKFFKPEEFDSPDEPGSGSKMDLDFIQSLDALRINSGMPIIINSGYRTAEHNYKVGGKKNSAHLRGLAADIRCEDSWIRFRFLKVIMSLGLFNRIEIVEKHLHIDKDWSLAQNVCIFGKGV